MTPFFFGSRDRRLFGVFQPAEGARARRRAVVLCPAWGGEYLFTHRAVRRLSVLLNQAGFDTLRFDYFGTGDSAGDAPDGDVAGWIGDIEIAMDEVRSIADTSDVSLVGLRLGGTLAAEVCAGGREKVAALVLWDPVIAGADYPGELHALCAANGRIHEPYGAKGPRPRSPAAGGGFEYDGFPMSAALERELAKLRLDAVANALPARTLLLVSGDPARSGAATAALAQRRDIVAGTVHVAGALPWIDTWPQQNQGVPAEALQAIRAWLG